MNKGFKFYRQKTFNIEIHRTGWNWVMKHMYERFNDDKSTIILEDFFEKTFDWDYCYSKRPQLLPHHQLDWIGFMHNPLLVPKPFDIKASFLNICSRLPSLTALKKCKGIFTLSEDMKESLDYLFTSFNILNVPIEFIYHPTDLNVKKFNFDNFNKNKKICNIGYWLRDFQPFFLLDCPNIEKHVMLGRLPYAHEVYNSQLKDLKKKLTYNSSVKINHKVIAHKYIENDTYDNILSSSIAFLNLIDTSANNGVIECISRDIPLLINPHPAVVEYLGEEYPFYYLTLEEANQKVNDLQLIKRTHLYLKNMDKTFLDINEFMDNFENSDIVSNLLLN